MSFDWQDVLMDEDNGLPVPAAKEDLPSDNEKEGEDNGQGSEASGALSEDDDPKGMDDTPNGKDPISGTNSTEYDDLMDELMNEYTDEDDSEDDKSDDDEKSDDDSEDDKGEDDKGDKEEDTKDEYIFDEFFYDEEGGLPVPPVKEDLPSENEKEGEDNGWDSEAAGALSEDDTDPGMKDYPRGKDPITGTPSTGYDDLMDILMDKDDEEEDDKEDDDKKEDQGEDKGSDDDGASKDDDVKGDDDEDVKDFADFFFDADTEIPDGPEGTKLEPADPVDGNGKAVCPIGDPDLPSNLTEPVIVPSDDPGTKDELLDSFREEVRFSFGDF